MQLKHNTLFALCRVGHLAVASVLYSDTHSNFEHVSLWQADRLHPAEVERYRQAQLLRTGRLAPKMPIIDFATKHRHTPNAIAYAGSWKER